MFSLINRIKELYKPLADCRRSYGVYSNNGNFEIRAISDDDVFVVASNIPFFMVAELIAELLNVAAGVAGNKPTAEVTATNDSWLDRMIRHGKGQAKRGV